MGKITIDRSVPFDPVTFLGNGWSIEEEDEKALAITEVDFKNVRLEAMLRPGEMYVNGVRKLERMKKAGHIRLDAKIFQTLWENQYILPEKWKEKTNYNTTFLFFDGTLLRDPRGFCYVLYLYWDFGEWYWHYDWLGLYFDAYCLSAVLAN